MRAEDFTDGPFGRAFREPGTTWAFTYYLPREIPRDVQLGPQVIAALSEADAALGQLHGLGTLITDPSLLIGPYLRREALASTRIEGTQASLSDVFQAELDEARPTEDVLEVQRYLEATKLAHDLVSTLPLTQRLILQVHERLLRDVRGEERRPGEFRTSPVWIGGAGATPESAPFVPPLPEHLPHLLADWERFVNDDTPAYPALIQAALMHYQFETIHPFLDGNGRIGRLLINLQLMLRRRLNHPLLYLSTYFETHRSEYYERLQGVRERGDIDAWLLFFLEAVREQAGDAITRSQRLVQVRESYFGEAIQARSSLPRLVAMIVENPFVTVRAVESRLGLTNQGARTLILSAVSRGWLVSLGRRGRGSREYWYAPGVFDVMNAPMAYDVAQPDGDPPMNAPRLELVWPGKDKFLLVPKDETGKPVWVERDHPAASEVRLADFTGVVGDVPEDPYAANLLFTGDSLDVLRILCEVPEYRAIYRGKVKLVYIDPPFPGQLRCYRLGCGCASEGVHVDVEVGSVAA